MAISAWWAIALAVPVLVFGELLVRRSRLLSRLNMPASVVGGLCVALIVLAGNLSGAFHAHFQTDVAARWWTWLFCAEPDWANTPAKVASTPFILAFFACLGLNSSWSLLKRGSQQALIFLGLAALLAVIQNGVGLAMAKLLDLPPLLGLICGSVSLTGGHITALGFADDFERAGLPNALGKSMAVATCGVVASAVIGGIVGGLLIKRKKLLSSVTEHAAARTPSPGDGLFSDLRSLVSYGRPFLTHLLQSAGSGILADFRALVQFGKPLLFHLALVCLCLKLGSWINWGVQAKVTFPVYIGAMLIGLLLRNLLGLAGAKWIQSEIIERLMSVALGFFMTIAMMSLDLFELSQSVAPMFLIIVVQVLVMALFAWWVTFRLMGRDYDAAVIASGHVGFGLGETPNALANMKALVEVFGPAPQAFLVVAVVVNLLIKLVNAANISVFMNFLKP